MIVLMYRSAVSHGPGRSKPRAGGQPRSRRGHRFFSRWCHSVISGADERRCSRFHRRCSTCEGQHRAAPHLRARSTTMNFINTISEHSTTLEKKTAKTEFNSSWRFFLCSVNKDKIMCRFIILQKRFTGKVHTDNAVTKALDIIWKPLHSMLGILLILTAILTYFFLYVVSGKRTLLPHIYYAFSLRENEVW